MNLEPQCTTPVDLCKEWGRVVNMCKGTEVRPEDGWRLDGLPLNQLPLLIADPTRYAFSIGIVEGKHVFRGDKGWSKLYNMEVTVVDTTHFGKVVGIRYKEVDGSSLLEDFSFNPPKQEPIIPEGFTKWEGGEWTGHPKDAVEVIFGGGSHGVEYAKQLYWKWFYDGGFADIIAYKITKKYEPDTVQQAKLGAKLRLTTYIAEVCRKALEKIKNRLYKAIFNKYVLLGLILANIATALYPIFNASAVGGWIVVLIWFFNPKHYTWGYFK